MLCGQLTSPKSETVVYCTVVTKEKNRVRLDTKGRVPGGVKSVQK